MTNSFVCGKRARAFAADPPEPAQPSPCYPTAVTRSEDGGEIRKMYDLGPEVSYSFVVADHYKLCLEKMLVHCIQKRVD